MTIAILAPSDSSYIASLLPGYPANQLPVGYNGAPWLYPIIEQLLAVGHKVVAITTTNLIDDDFSIKEYTQNDFTWVVIPMRKNIYKPANGMLGRMLDFFAFEQRQMLKVLTKYSPDFVHAMWSYEFAGAGFKSGLPLLVTIHDNAYNILRYSKNIYRFFRLLMSERILNKVRFASTVSPYMIAYAQKRCQEVRTIPNPARIDLTVPEVELLIQSKIKTLNNPKIIMINNGWDSRKNGRSGLIAFKYFLKECPGATLHLFGNESELNGKAWQDAQNINFQNIYFGGIADYYMLQKELKTCHLLLHPALEESFGVVLIEAMSFGIPVIGGGNSGGVPWVINDNSLLTDVLDPNEISKKMICLLKNPDFYLQKSWNGYRNVLERFSAKSIAGEYLNYYKHILEKW